MIFITFPLFFKSVQMLYAVLRCSKTGTVGDALIIIIIGPRSLLCKLEIKIKIYILATYICNEAKKQQGLPWNAEKAWCSRVSTHRGAQISALRISVCGWHDSQEILPQINVFGLAAPHAGCLEDSDKWLDNKMWNGGRQILPSLIAPQGARVHVCVCA